MQLPSRTRVLILQHPDEVGHALNTARLAALGLENAELRVGEVFADLHFDPAYRACLLFPGEMAQPLPLVTPDADERPLLLVVPDGTWRKARKLLHLNPALAALPRCLPAAGPELALPSAQGAGRRRAGHHRGHRGGAGTAGGGGASPSCYAPSRH